MANIKKKLKKLKRKVKALQDLNTTTESRLSKLELDIELMHANQADYDIMFEDLADNQHDIALNAMVNELSEEELDEVFNDMGFLVGDLDMDDGFVPDSDKTEQSLDELRNASYRVDTVQPQSQDELRNEYHGKFDDYEQQHVVNPRQKI